MIRNHARDHYETLQVPENATATIIARAYDKRIAELKADLSLAPKKRKKAEDVLNEAYYVLTDEKLKTAYDEALQRKREVAGGLVTSKTTVVARTVFLLALLGLVFAFYYNHSQNQAEIRRLERIESEKAAAKDEADRQRFEQIRQAARERERLERLKAEEDRLEQIRLESENQHKRGRFVADRTVEQKAQEQADREAAERNAKLKDEQRRKAAVAETERQKRFLQDAARQAQQPQ